MDERETAVTEAEAAQAKASEVVNRPRLFIVDEDGMQQDVTEKVVTVLDALANSMDWGSGFLEESEIKDTQELMRDLKFPNIPRYNSFLPEDFNIPEAT